MAFEGFVEDGGEQGIEFDGGLGLEGAEGVDFGLEIIEVSDNLALLPQKSFRNQPRALNDWLTLLPELFCRRRIANH
ncbi:hypothetical protein QGP82_18850 [Leptothoe sp. LEGE 181152]|nr:hypothetical protein [Leptothoe sp. LEGE 181152]